MDYQAIIDQYYPQDSALRRLLIKHSRQVADRALYICDHHRELPVDRQFLEEAAMLHDIGVFRCDAPSIYCHGTEPYIKHGPIGGELLRAEGFPRHARVAERHTGTGLPGYEPETLEEQIICYADKFYSKTRLDIEKTPEQAIRSLEKFGIDGIAVFKAWMARFE
jgi:uncharacterized protein